jgi:lysophospholipase L1-like esterase
LKDIARRSALAGFSLVFGLIIAEGVLRAFGFSVPLYYEPDPRLGWILRAGASGWYTDEGRAFLRINSVGMHDREHPVAKPEGVYRIVVLGDSYSEAKQVPIDSTYWFLLPSHLARCGFQAGKTAEALNFSVSGYGTAQELILLRVLAARYQPDLVLLQFTGSNDVRNNSRSLEPGKNRPFFVLNADGRLELDDSFASQPGFRRVVSPVWRAYRGVARYSRLVQLVRAATHRPKTQQLATQTAIAEAGLDEAELSPPRDPRWEDAWRVTEALIAEVRNEAARHGARTLVMTVPWPAQVLPNPREREAFAARAGVPDLGYPDRRIEAFGRAHDIPVLTLASGMAQAAEAESAFLNGFGDRQGIGHWNSAGHRVAAGLIAGSLCSGSFGTPGQAPALIAASLD